MNPLHFIRTARKLARGRGGKPQQVDLRRAESAAYYAMFHCVCLAYANLLVGVSNTRSEGAWLQAYRSLNHGQVAQCCNRMDIMQEFSFEMQQFCRTLNRLQKRRINADYNPNYTFYRSQVLNDIIESEKAIVHFNNSELPERKAFVAYATSKFRKFDQ